MYIYSLYDVDDIVTIGREGLDSKYLTIPNSKGLVVCLVAGADSYILRPGTDVAPAFARFLFLYNTLPADS